MGILVTAVAALAVLIFFAVRADQMSAAREAVPVRVQVPPIDARQPEHTDSATFAEG